MSDPELKYAKLKAVENIISKKAIDLVMSLAQRSARRKTIKELGNLIVAGDNIRLRDTEAFKQFKRGEK